MMWFSPVKNKIRGEGEKTLGGGEENSSWIRKHFFCVPLSSWGDLEECWLLNLAAGILHPSINLNLCRIEAAGGSHSQPFPLSNWTGVGDLRWMRAEKTWKTLKAVVHSALSYDSGWLGEEFKSFGVSGKEPWMVQTIRFI